jgi:two-component sensor histidine kinase
MGVTSLLIASPVKQTLAQRSSQAKVDGLRCGGCDLTLEADHRIANHLAMLSSYVGLRQKEFGQIEGGATGLSVQLAFDGIRTVVDAISRLHRALLTNTYGTGADLSEYVRHVCGSLRSGLSGAIELTEDLRTGCRVRSDQILPLTQIVSEVITNAIKHSHVGGEGGRVLVRCHPVTERELELEIVDDGKGLPQDFDPLTGAGLGFRLVRALTAQLGIRSGFESSIAGTRFWLRVERAPEATTGVLASSMNGLAGTGAANSESS